MDAYVVTIGSMVFLVRAESFDDARDVAIEGGRMYGLDPEPEEADVRFVQLDGDAAVCAVFQTGLTSA